ncbi:response regulator [Cohnella endophytica]|uniref:Circadian input-output histidine kinase CikA n=2 Tax=Cohnella endophytica TaxID=2419778 RepID=A0A494XHK1_9BACL|nr:response regulator [Cohnella endophytica]
MDEFRARHAGVKDIVSQLASEAWTESDKTGEQARYLILLSVLVSLSAGIASFLMFRRSSQSEKVLLDTLQQLSANIEENERQNWLKTEYARLVGLAQGVTDLKLLATRLISEIAKAVEGGHGAFFVLESDPKSTYNGEYALLGSYAYKENKQLPNRFRLGEGLVGQCALDNSPIVLNNVPEDYVAIQSGLGEYKPLTITVLPVAHENEVVAVIEIASLQPFTPIQLELLEQLSLTLGVLIDSVKGRHKTERLLLEAQLLSEELQSQQEELRASNDELAAQTQTLKQSEEKLKAQSEELQVINEEMELKTVHLEAQKTDIERQNDIIRHASEELQLKADELALSSKYKSEFLANMSHELRTPLNSLLILSKSLADNGEGNLTEDQIESAKIIHGGGQDLLRLINDILDLSKVEAGKMQLNPERIPIDDFLRNLQYQFKPVASEKGIKFECAKAADLPEALFTDAQRTEQILKNLLSNAFKFTSEGTVYVSIERPAPDIRFTDSDLTRDNSIAFKVRDTGIGIPSHKQEEIFRSFQQADGSTSRKYGGTGLGLTISRELASLLRGEIHLESREGEGSCFTLILPLELPEAALKTETESSQLTGQASRTRVEPAKEQVRATAEKPIPRSGERSRSLLVVESDPEFAGVLRRMAEVRGFETLIAPNGTEALQLAKRNVPDAIVLNPWLPDMDGQELLRLLKDSTKTKNVPTHLITGKDEVAASLEKGAVGFLTSPGAEALEAIFAEIDDAMRPGRIRQVLVIEDDEGNRKAIRELMRSKDIEMHDAGSVSEGMDALRERTFDCVILDLGLPDGTGFEWLERASEEGRIPPVVIYTGRELSQEEYKDLNRFTDSIVIKGENSPERLLDEVMLFLHSVGGKTTKLEGDRTMIRRVHDTDNTLQGRKILLVDDDLRNTFALSKVLKQQGLDVIMADNGKLAIEKLQADDDIELVLMDMMMPVMDGYEAMREIRSNGKYESLPIIALTAKAMIGDREKCIESGANDYMTKPLDVDRLLSLLRVWLSSDR